MLLQAVKSELRLIVDKDFKRLSKKSVFYPYLSVYSKKCGSDTYVGHEFLACRSNLLREGGAEHHDLLVVGSDTEDLLNIPAHV